MRDLTRRIERYRLGRYGRPPRPVARRLSWLWLAGALWLIWIAALSEHSLWRISRLHAENQRAVREDAAVRQETARLEGEAADPRRRRQRAERWLREQGGMARPDEIIYRIQDAAPDTLPR